MSRREFSKQVKRDAFLRAAGCCEGWTPAGTICGARLAVGKFHYDHVIPDGEGGEPILTNCAVICIACHKHKTRNDVRSIAKTKRISDKHRGIRKPSRFPASRDSIWKKKMDGSVVRR